MLLNFLDTDLYERQGKALTNFNRTLPEETSDLAQELTKDPYEFAFTGIAGRYNEQIVNLPQVVADSEKTILPQVVAELFMVPVTQGQVPVIPSIENGIWIFLRFY